MPTQTRSARRRMNASHSASCSSVTHSLGWCACAMCPGPQMIAGMPLLWKMRRLGAEGNLAELLRAWLQALPNSAISLPPCVSNPGSVDR